MNSISLESQSHTNELSSSGNSSTVGNVPSSNMGTNLDEAKEFFSAYDDTHKEFLTLSAYAGRISRYTLEFFTDPRKAALCFNWLKRKTNLCDLHSGGAFSLKEEIVGYARTLHAHENPRKAKSGPLILGT